MTFKKIIMMIIAITLLSMAMVGIIFVVKQYAMISAERMFVMIEVSEYQIVHLMTIAVITTGAKFFDLDSMIGSLYLLLKVVTSIVFVLYIISFSFPNQIYIVEVVATITTISTWLWLLYKTIKAVIGHNKISE